MELGKNIKSLRAQHNYSQEDLAELVYVTRQTISKWETDKNYPDLNSLILLSKAFNTTIDNLIKGDLDFMKQTVKKQDIALFKKWYILEWIGFALGAPIFAVSFRYGFIPGIATGAVLFIGGSLCTIKTHSIRKQYDVQTFREIIAFTKGETLDEIAKSKEAGKKNYQWWFSILLAFVVLALIVKFIAPWVLNTFFGIYPPTNY